MEDVEDVEYVEDVEDVEDVDAIFRFATHAVIQFTSKGKNHHVT